MPSEIANQKQLSERLGLTSRRIRDLEAEGVILCLGRGRYDVGDAQWRYALFRSRDTEAIADVISEVDDLLKAAARGVERLDPEAFDPAEARRIGPMIERADGLLRLLNAMRDEAERAVADHVRRATIFPLFGGLMMRVAEAQAFERRPAGGRAA